MILRRIASVVLAVQLFWGGYLASMLVMQYLIEHMDCGCGDVYIIVLLMIATDIPFMVVAVLALRWGFRS